MQLPSIPLKGVELVEVEGGERILVASTIFLPKKALLQGFVDRVMQEQIIAAD